MTKGCRFGPSSRTRSSLHSKWIGTSLTRGAAILTLGIGVRPVSLNSESPAGKALAESTISRHTSSVTTLKQNSPVSRTLSVCFSVPSGLRAIVSEIIGGMTQTTVKKENGARLVTPLLLNVDAQPIGRGTDSPREQSVHLPLFDDCGGGIRGNAR